MASRMPRPPITLTMVAHVEVVAVHVASIATGALRGRGRGRLMSHHNGPVGHPVDDHLAAAHSAARAGRALGQDDHVAAAATAAVGEKEELVAAGICVDHEACEVLALLRGHVGVDALADGEGQGEAGRAACRLVSRTRLA